MNREKPQADTVDKHPEEYRQDLNPDAMAGQNIGVAGPHAEKSSRTAYDIKPLHNRLKNLLDDDLKQIRVLAEGTRLQQGATYVDLNDLDRGEFTATGNMTARVHNYYVPKDEVHYLLWNLLIGVDNPDRLGTSRD